MNDNQHDACPTQCIARSAVGGVSACPRCGSVHLTLDYLTVRLQPDAFRELVAMLGRAQARLDADRASRPAAADANPSIDKPLH